MSSWWGWLLRRVVLTPLMPVLLLLACLLWLLVLAGSVVLCPVLAAVRRERPRLRALRVASMALAYLLAECLCLLGCFGLWLVSGCGWRLTAGWFVDAHRSLLRTFLGALLRLAQPVFGFRLQVQEPDRHPEDLLRASSDVPLLVLARHAGPGASFALVHLLLTRYGRQLQVVLKDTLRLDPAIDLLLTRYGRQLQVVLKDTLRLDPAIDLLLTRTGCTWIPANRTDPDEPARRVGQAAAGLHGRQTLLLFPEGADWTPLRHLAAVAKLHQRGLVRQAQQALRMPHVLPPRPAGTVAALQGAPNADVLIFTHTGHDALLDATSAWRALPLTRPLQMAWWRAPADSLPSHAPDQINNWLHNTWVNIDAWIAEQNDLIHLQRSLGNGSSR